MKKEQFEYVYQQFKTHLIHYWLNEQYDSSFLQESADNLYIEKSFWKDCYYISGKKYKLFDQIRSLSIAEEIISCIRETEMLFV